MRRLTLLLILICSLPSLGWAASGVKGRVAWRGELVPGLTVRAYRSIEDIARRQPVAASKPTAQDGTYRLQLEPGRYYLTARDFDEQARPGDHFCYYSGGPVNVEEGRFRQVGFNLIRVPQEQDRDGGKRSGIRGEVSFQGQALERCYLYVYRETASDFKGPAYYIQPVERGSFRLSLPPGDYYLLARKRAKGGRFGPIEIGDYFNYYYGNPVRIEKGQLREIKLETITRLSMLEEDETGPFQGVKGQVFGPDGKGVAGLRVFAYRRPEMTGTPSFFSTGSDAEGYFELPIVESGEWYLLAREAFGGPAGGGELYGKYRGSAGSQINLTNDQQVQEVKIHVAPID